MAPGLLDALGVQLGAVMRDLEEQPVHDDEDQSDEAVGVSGGEVAAGDPVVVGLPHGGGECGLRVEEDLSQGLALWTVLIGCGAQAEGVLVGMVAVVLSDAAEQVVQPVERFEMPTGADEFVEERGVLCGDLCVDRLVQRRLAGDVCVQGRRLDSDALGDLAKTGLGIPRARRPYGLRRGYGRGSCLT